MRRKKPLGAKPKKQPLLAKKQATNPKKKTLWNKADKLAGEWFRKCPCNAQGAGGLDCSGRIEWCHIVSRSVGRLRWHPLNAVPMCSAHHRYFTQRPLEFGAFVGEDNRQKLNEIERSLTKPDPEFWIAWYKGRTDCFATWDGEI